MTLWSADVGPYVWHDFEAERMRTELHAIASRGLFTVRLLLPWDAFMPEASHIPDRRLRQLETVLDICSEASLRAVLVLNAQSLGDCVMLPPYAIDVSRRRRGVRVVTDAVVQPGSPRDQHTDPLLLDVQLRWIETMLRAFAGHDAIGMWDLGHNPASTVRPRRIQDQRSWCATLAAALHEHGERCTLTLGADDLTSARGVRPSLLAEELDVIGFAVDADGGGVAEAAAGTRRLCFLAQLMLAMVGGRCPVAVHVAAPAASLDSPRLARHAADALVEVGCAATHALWWASTGPRTRAVPPFDNFPDLAQRGIVDAAGEPTPFGAAWLEQMARESERRPAQPWPAQLDIDDYYANLPESLLEMQRAWETENSDLPGMLD